MENEDRIYYHKLIRDNVPGNMDKKGVDYETRVLVDEEYRKELIKKVAEEAVGLQHSKDRDELIDELCDVRAVIEAIYKLESITQEELDAAFKKNMDKKGGFNDKIWLEWSADTGYKTNEPKGTQE